MDNAAYDAAKLAYYQKECTRLNNKNVDLELMVHGLEDTARRIARHAVIEPEQPSDLIVIDIETTGLSKIDDEILQVSMIDSSGSTLYNSYLKPLHLTTWEEAQKINHISPATVVDAPNIYLEMPKINGILKHAKTIVGYNHIGFDIPFLQLFGAVFPEHIEQFDVMLEFAPIYGQWCEQHGSYKWQSLATCAEHYGYDWGSDTAHDSLADCRATLHCYQQMMKGEQQNGKR